MRRPRRHISLLLCLRRCWIHALLLGVIVVQVAAARRSHLTDDELHAMRESGTPRERVLALHILANRDSPVEHDPKYVRRLLRRKQPALVHELAMTTNLMRFDSARRRRSVLIERLGDSPAGVRCRFLRDHRVGERNWITRSSLQRFLEALDENGAPHDPN